MGKWFTIVCGVIVLLLLPASVQAFTVVIDPGHGGHDPGAVGINGLYEKDVNLDVSLKLKQELENRGYEVKMSRQTDTFLTLPERVDFANRSGGSVFVSIHANAHNDRSIRGSLVLYYDDRYPQAAYPASAQMRGLSADSREFASLALNGLVRSVGTANRGLVPSAAYVVRSGIMPSILIETAFLSNRQDAALLADEAVRAKMAAGIAEGIAKYMPPAFYDIGAHWAREPILRLERLGIVQGYNRAYYPNRQMSRAEFLTLMDRINPFDETDHGDGEASQEHGNGIAPDTSGDASNTTDDAPNTSGDASSASGDASNASDDAASGSTEPLPDSVSDSNTTSTSTSDSTTFNTTNNYATTIATSNTTSDDEQNEPIFTDLHPDHWAYDTVVKAAKKGIIAGYDDQTVRPDQPISRAEMAVLFDQLVLEKTEGSQQSDAQRNGSTFADVPANVWYTKSVTKLYELGYVRGMTNDTYAPHRQLTRAEGASIVDRYLISDLGAVAREQAEQRLNMHL